MILTELLPELQTLNRADKLRVMQFMEFDVCFYRSQQAFEIHPKTDLTHIRH
jgi:hypothetical protein